MALDAAEGIEEQTRKLFEVSRLRDVPIITFVNSSTPRGATRWTDRAVAGDRCDPGRIR